MASRSNGRPPASRKVKPLPEIPDKLYYRIGEVARLCGVETYVLRFWETEFPQLKPNKSGAGQRLYRRREVELARRIRDLLYRDGYTIPGARQAILDASREASKNANGKDDAAALPLVRAGLKTGPRSPRLSKLRLELKQILGLLSDSPASGLSSGRPSGHSGKSGAHPSAGVQKAEERPDLFD
jgi:DNA-binding transcriptional MerR regulator